MIVMFVMVQVLFMNVDVLALEKIIVIVKGIVIQMKIRLRVTSVKRLLILPLMTFWLAGCAGAMVSAGATTGVVAYQERSVERLVKDKQIGFRIFENWFQFEHTLPTKVSVEVYEGRALLTGAVSNPQIRADAVRLAWKALEVKEVLNEIQVTGPGDLFDIARDPWITAQLKFKITFDENIVTHVPPSAKHFDMVLHTLDRAKATVYIDYLCPKDRKDTTTMCKETWEWQKNSRRFALKGKKSSDPIAKSGDEITKLLKRGRVQLV